MIHSFVHLSSSSLEGLLGEGRRRTIKRPDVLSGFRAHAARHGGAHS